jgi:hypothetical protein
MNIKKNNNTTMKYNFSFSLKFPRKTPFKKILLNIAIFRGSVALIILSVYTWTEKPEFVVTKKFQ